MCSGRTSRVPKRRISPASTALGCISASASRSSGWASTSTSGQRSRSAPTSLTWSKWWWVNSTCVGASPSCSAEAISGSTGPPASMNSAGPPMPSATRYVLEMNCGLHARSMTIARHRCTTAAARRISRRLPSQRAGPGGERLHDAARRDHAGELHRAILDGAVPSSGCRARSSGRAATARLGTLLREAVDRAQDVAGGEVDERLLADRESQFCGAHCR